MSEKLPDRELLERLQSIPEIISAGFTVREGLTGSGVTILKGRGYFGSWRAVGNALSWIQPAQTGEPTSVEDVDEAVRATLLSILQHLEERHVTPVSIAS